MNNIELEKIAEKIVYIEKDLAEAFHSASLTKTKVLTEELENLIKNLTLEDLDILDQKIQEHMNK